MKKIRLNVEKLTVETFQTDSEGKKTRVAKSGSVIEAAKTGNQGAQSEDAGAV